MNPAQSKGSYASAISLDELQKLGPELIEAGHHAIDASHALTYAPSRGSDELRERVAEIHSGDATLTADHVVITQGSLMANYLVLTTICGPGDHIICQYPTFGQLYLLPKFMGVDVTLWKASEDKGWALDVDELATLVKPNTKAIVVNNPCNPTGFVLPRADCERIIAIARRSNLILISDEVFRPLFYEQSAPPMVSLGYQRTISTSSISKAYGLPGVRIGWVVTPDAELMKKFVTVKDYAINISRLDDGVATFALQDTVRTRILARNIALMKESISLVDGLVQRTGSQCSWTPAAGAGTAFVKILSKDGTPVDDVDFCERLVEREGISVIPGDHCFSEPAPGEFKGYVRINLGEPQRLRASLDALEAFIRQY
ncbi:pyridoxal phosphate-dependent transferase [Stachybotrys elegans]|uniref:Pyridoxal phosphate-dependent transferase n=1 Tax=Stachybotrys elegans TaxID=80388 RepID=A0A8K0WPV3_9HYPO|nr:pyridoxal phosphate-dependent transferase [Stachybotrys elegans]